MPMSEDEKKGWWMVAGFFLVLIVAITFGVRSCGGPAVDPYEPAAKRLDIHGDQHKAVEDMDK